MATSQGATSSSVTSHALQRLQQRPAICHCRSQSTERDQRHGGHGGHHRALDRMPDRQAAQPASTMRLDGEAAPSRAAR